MPVAVAAAGAAGLAKGLSLNTKQNLDVWTCRYLSRHRVLGDRLMRKLTYCKAKEPRYVEG
jgi:hypothetical protein